MVNVDVVDFISFFFFKQKTAYEMRISDWSSDVCSSDLAVETVKAGFVGFAAGAGKRDEHDLARELALPFGEMLFLGHRRDDDRSGDRAVRRRRPGDRNRGERERARGHHPRARSEEHTSELQSLMRISYAVFCSKKT